MTTTTSFLSKLRAGKLEAKATSLMSFATLTASHQEAQPGAQVQTAIRFLDAYTPFSERTRNAVLAGMEMEFLTERLTALRFPQMSLRDNAKFVLLDDTSLRSALIVALNGLRTIPTTSVGRVTIIELMKRVIDGLSKPTPAAWQSAYPLGISAFDWLTALPKIGTALWRVSADSDRLYGLVACREVALLKSMIAQYDSELTALYAELLRSTTEGVSNASGEQPRDLAQILAKMIAIGVSEIADALSYVITIAESRNGR